MLKLMTGLALAGLVSGCVDPKAFESDPVKVKTNKGVVTCQLYTKDEVLWDRAVDFPKSMTVLAADKVCVAEGHKQRGF
jgi:hypothetical protein